MQTLKPKIRAVEIFPTILDGKEMIILKDPLELNPQMIFLSPESFFLVTLMDGSRTFDDLRMEFFKKRGILPSSDEIAMLINQLSELGLLEDENFKRILKGKAEEYLNKGIRPPVCAGSSYPSFKEDLIKFLEEIEKIEVPERERRPDFLISPHLDINISKVAYAHSYKNLDLGEKNIIVIFGVAHQGLSKNLSLFPIPFETPLGKVQVNEEISKKFIEKYGSPDDYEILSHMKEHSIELQLIFLQYFLKKEFSIVPILVDGSRGSFGQFKEFFDNLFSRKDIFFIAGIDLSHIGPRYGDEFPATEDFMERIKGEERVLFEYLIKKDRENFEKFSQEKGTVLRICGMGVLKMLFEFPVREAVIRNHFTGFMPPLASAVNCISGDLYF